MFDLFRSRDKLVRIFLGGLLLIVALSMVTYLIPNYGGTEGTAQDPIVAEVGSDKITTRNAQIVIQQALKSKSVSPAMLPLLIPQMVDQMVTERALAYQAERMGFHVSEEQVSNAIRLTIPQLFPQGKFVGRDIYAGMLAQQNLTIQDFESDMARQLLVTRLREVAVEGTVVAQADVEAEFRRRNEKVAIEYVMIAPEKFRSDVKITDADALAYFEKNRAAYKVPEKRSAAILVIDQSKLEQSLAPKDADLRRLYESDKDRFRSGERVKARHILLNTTGKSADEEAKIKAKAEDLLKQIKAKGDFAELAKKNSEDTTSARKGGELDWIVRGQTVKPFEDAAFSLKPGETSGLIKTEYGYHIIQVEEHEQARLKSFDDVKALLTDEYRKTASSQAIQDLMDHAALELRKNPDHPDKVAADLKLPPPVRAENFGPGDPLPEVGVNPEFEKSIAGLGKGEVSQPVALPPNRVALAVITAVIPVHPATFEEVKKQIKAALERQRLDEIVHSKTTKLLADAKASGDLRKAAKAMSFKTKTAAAFDRNGAVEGLGQAVSFEEAFNQPDGAIFGPVLVPAGRVIVKVVSHTPADMAQLQLLGPGIRDELKSRKARERNMLFEDGLREGLIKEGKIKIHQQVVDRLIASYKG
ncbi:MAG: peptidylprolyl isomerase [Candidatus Solibacter usitatus]|nr:peptidylprolyl isomerase [Candidatus Solibacter usitatus]